MPRAWIRTTVHMFFGEGDFGNQGPVDSHSLRVLINLRNSEFENKQLYLEMLTEVLFYVVYR